jgi:hypothetical protein
MIQGKAYWAKVVGDPVKGYNPGEFEWSIDVTVDANTKKQLKELGVLDRVKDKADERGAFITFKRKSVKADGTPAKPIRIVDSDGKEWDGKTKIGNGSIVNVKFAVNEIPAFGGGKPRLKPSILAVQVWDLVPYEGKGDDFPQKSNKKAEAEDWSAEGDDVSEVM